ncbi:MAG TPA: glycosyltransferase family 2 protein [Caulobacteraceae bacterium]|jgi:glycosyltransferase involved in cell wall biosynthesis|nr:glycosyltransferase family 2 protein [Caulobacteraceae bacterium]
MDGSGGGPQTQGVDVTIVMPCLNEVQCLPHCLKSAREALDRIEARLGLTGEVVIADNGSTDGSQALAHKLGARVVAVSERGYGAAIRGGFAAARGRFLVMGDADGSYDFRDAVPMVAALVGGADLCMGSRFKGGIESGAMPWKNRYIGNPVLTGVLKLLFHARISDAHCGLRALTRASFERLRLTGSGMEFASEMVIKAALKGEAIVETPVVLHPDLRDRPPHLRPWRDGWRHLRYLFMLSPSWVFAVPAMIGAVVGLSILAAAGWYVVTDARMVTFGAYWTILGAALLSLSHMAAVMGLAGQLYAEREGYRKPRPWLSKLSRLVSLETMLLSGVGAIVVGLAILLAVLLSWFARGMGPAANVFSPVLGSLFLSLGFQNVLGGFLLSIVAGAEAQFLKAPADPSAAGEPAQPVPDLLRAR